MNLLLHAYLEFLVKAVIQLSFYFYTSLSVCFGGLSSKKPWRRDWIFGPYDSVAPHLGGMEGGWYGSGHTK